MQKEKHLSSVDQIVNFHCPRFKEIPTIGLYKDQVISYIEENLGILNEAYDEKLLTPTMLNNYVKQKVVSPPKGRKYTEKHIAYFIVVCVLKRVYRINEISHLIKLQTETCSTEEGYNYFCKELENSLQIVFNTRDFNQVNQIKQDRIEGEVLRSTTMSFAHQLYIKRYLKHVNSLNPIQKKD